MEHEKRSLAKSVDLAQHMEQKAQWDAMNEQLNKMRRYSAFYTSTLRNTTPKETEHERDAREYVTGIIDHAEYERREEIRLAREAESSTAGTAA